MHDICEVCGELAVIHWKTHDFCSDGCQIKFFRAERRSELEARIERGRKEMHSPEYEDAKRRPLVL